MDHDEVRAALERLIVERREDYAGLSRLIGRNAAYVQQYIKRGVPKRLAEEDRRKLARYFGIDESVLGGRRRQSPEGNEALIPIPRFDVRASAGAGSFTEGAAPVAHLGFGPQFLKQLCCAAPADLSIIQVRGDSMFPTLADGDDIMVDRSITTGRLTDGIYVLRRDDTLMVKRIAVHPGSRRLTISSDNRAYPTWADCEPDSVDVLGRVVWSGRKIA